MNVRYASSWLIRSFSLKAFRHVRNSPTPILVENLHTRLAQHEKLDRDGIWNFLTLGRDIPVPLLHRVLLSVVQSYFIHKNTFVCALP